MNAKVSVTKEMRDAAKSPEARFSKELRREAFVINNSLEREFDIKPFEYRVKRLNTLVENGADINSQGDIEPDFAPNFTTKFIADYASFIQEYPFSSVEVFIDSETDRLNNVTGYLADIYDNIQTNVYICALSYVKYLNDKKMEVNSTVKKGVISNTQHLLVDYFTNKAPSDLLEKLRDVMKGRKGTKVARVWDVLEEEGYIRIPSIGGWSDIYRAFKIEFGDIGSYSGINDNRACKRKSTDKEIEKEKIKVKDQLGTK